MSLFRSLSNEFFHFGLEFSVFIWILSFKFFYPFSFQIIRLNYLHLNSLTTTFLVESIHFNLNSIHLHLIFSFIYIWNLSFIYIWKLSFIYFWILSIIYICIHSLKLFLNKFINFFNFLLKFLHFHLKIFTHFHMSSFTSSIFI